MQYMVIGACCFKLLWNSLTSGYNQYKKIISYAFVIVCKQYNCQYFYSFYFFSLMRLQANINITYYIAIITTAITKYITFPSVMSITWCVYWWTHIEYQTSSLSHTTC